MVTDIGVEVFKLLGEHLACEMRALRQDHRIGGQIIDEGASAPRFRACSQEVLQAWSSSADVDAQEASCSETLGNLEPALIVFARTKRQTSSIMAMRGGGSD